MTKRPLSAMRRRRAKKFPPKLRSDIVEWDINLGPEVFGEASKVPLGLRIEIEIKADGKRVQVRLSPDDAYELREDIGHAIDQALGLAQQ